MKKDEIRSILMHFTQNMWYECWDDPVKPRSVQCFDNKLHLDVPTWNEAIDHIVKGGYNQVIIDLGDGVVFPSHPELAIEGTWPVEQFRNELKRLRSLGLEVIPKLNFSTCHDAWLKEYGRMVSTRKYYEVCKDLIRDTMYLFDRPRFLHIGMDEEEAVYMAKNYEHVVMRKGNLWWNDFLFYVKCVEDCGMRAWCWSDRVWNHREEFLKRMPKTVLQSNWYYYEGFDLADLKAKKSWWVKGLESYEILDKAGFEQVPTGGYYVKDKNRRNFANTVKYCDEHLNPDLVKGYMQTSWMVTVPQKREILLDAIDLGGEIFKTRG